MNDSTADRLNRLNRDFYDRFALPFAESRAAIPPGIQRSLQWLRSSRALLDLGCGDGRIGRLWAGESPNERSYVGIDFSAELLRQPAQPDATLPPGFELREADLGSPDWRHRAGLDDRKFDAVVCLAVLFHLPQAACRARFLEEMSLVMAPGGRAVLSVWQFLHVARLKRKIVPWSRLELDAADVEPGDFLLDWWRGGHGLRYVHHFDPSELEAMVERAGLRIVDTFRSDGATGDMSLFLWLEKG